ncbi:MAG: N-acetylmuramoyl-L-alanine amidase family protein [Armatimonadota bacterium]
MPKIVVLDPGHGGADPGAVGFVVEKDVALDIAKHARDHLCHFKDVQVVMTREGDQTVSLAERVRLANEKKADVFVSIHCNAGGGEGFESYHCPGSIEGQRLQQAIHSKVWDVLVTTYGIIPVALEAEHVEIAKDAPEAWIRDRGQKAARYYVLKNTTMPAVLLECLFVDDERDATLLQDSGFRWRLGVQIAEGIALHLKLEVENMWNPEAEIRKLKDRGLITAFHTPTQSIMWGEFATVLNRLYDHFSQVVAGLERRVGEAGVAATECARSLQNLKDGLKKAVGC